MPRRRRRRRRVPEGTVVIDLGERVESMLRAQGIGFGGYRPWHGASPGLRPATAGAMRGTIEFQILVEARNALCGLCQEDADAHRCPAIAIRRMIAKYDPVYAKLSKKDWLPRRSGKGGGA